MDGTLDPFFGGPEDACPICLETMPLMTFRGTERIRLYCCGQLMCSGCNQEFVGRGEKLAEEALFDTDDPEEMHRRMEHVKQSVLCPMCREVPPTVGGNEASRYILKNAKKGKAWAEHEIGVKYEKGQGVRKDDAEAVRWFKLAAKQGHPWSMFSYANHLHQGLGVSRNFAEARRWYEKAAALGCPSSQHALAMDLLEGEHGAEKDTERAARLLRAAADQGHPDSENDLGNCYCDGDGVPRDLKEALVWYERAAIQGNTNGMSNAGRTLLNITGEALGSTKITGKCPIPRSVRWARLAAAKGDSQCAVMASRFEGMFSTECANCGKPQRELLRCTKCRIMRYCDKKCQVTHWKAGHKKDCVKS